MRLDRRPRRLCPCRRSHPALGDELRQAIALSSRTGGDDVGERTSPEDHAHLLTPADRAQNVLSEPFNSRTPISRVW